MRVKCYKYIDGHIKVIAYNWNFVLANLQTRLEMFDADSDSSLHGPDKIYYKRLLKQNYISDLPPRVSSYLFVLFAQKISIKFLKFYRIFICRDLIFTVFLVFNIHKLQLLSS